MKTKLTAVILVFLAVMVFNGCGSSKSTGSDKLGGTEWTLIELSGNKYEPVTGNEVTLKFDDQVTGISGRSTCNTYASSCTLKDNKMTIGGVLSTKMACDDMNTEIKYYNILTKAFAYQTYDKMLYLFDIGGVVILRFKAK